MNSFSILRLDNTTLNIVPVCVSSKQAGDCVPIMFYSFEIVITEFYTNLNTDNAEKTIRETLLIPILISIILFLIFSACLQKYMLKNINY